MNDVTASELAHAIIRNRAARKAAKQAARELCHGLALGDSFSLTLPATQPAKYDTYRAIASVARAILGAGHYQITQNRDNTATVKRIAANPVVSEPASAWPSPEEFWP